MRTPSALILTACCVLMQVLPAQAIVKKFNWKFRHADFAVELNLNSADYTYYRNMPRGYGYGHYTREQPGHEVLDAVAKALWFISKQHDLDDWEAINMTVAFVQQLGYQEEKNCKIEHAKYPIETLVDGGGDCEDTAILLASLLKKLGFSTVLISPPGHLAVGIACDNCGGTYVKYEGQEYYYIETTYPGWEIGEIPEQFNTEGCKLYEVFTPEDVTIRRSTNTKPGGIAATCTQPEHKFVENDTKPQPTPKPEPAPQTTQVNEENSDSFSGDNLIFPNKMHLNVNGQQITAYTHGGDGSVHVMKGADGKIRIYSTGETLIVLE